MKILHYSLGFPPYRSGGLTKFCVDLACQQLKEGHDVSMLWPGEMQLSGKRTRIRTGTPYKGIRSYEIINPNPVPYDEGIKEINEFMNSADETAYLQFLKELKPDALHIHTFMGMHESLITAAKKLGIKTCFTTHDFYPICPKVTLFRNGDVCPDAENCSSCPACNLTALSLKKIRLLQTPLYRKSKDSPIVKKLRKGHRDAYLSDEQPETEGKTDQKPEDYLKLRNYYGKILAEIDVIHYNSKVAKSVYERFFQLPENRIIPITHADIQDHRKKKEAHDKLLITYLGPQSAHKGYYMLKNALDRLWTERQDFQLNVFFEPVQKSAYEAPHGRYSYDEMGDLFQDTDVVIVPSIWFETFGYIAAEAMSYGVPVIVSSRVGAKDTVPDGGGIIFDDLSEEGILHAIKSLDPESICRMNEKLCQMPVYTIDQMSKEIREQCYC